MYQFTEDCLIGVKMIDEEHKGLFQIINEMESLLEDNSGNDKQEQIRELLGKLKQYAQEHFKHEEEYMDKIKHPEILIQKKQHEMFCQKMEEAGAAFENGDQNELINDLLKYLVQWLYRHIIGSDLMIGKMEPKLVKETQVSFVFTDEYKTGIDLVDEEHKELFRIIGEVSQVINNDFIPDKYDEIVSLLEQLKNYTKFHFSDEEKYMESIQYEGLPAQRRAHDAFVNRLEEMNLEQIDEHQQETLEELMVFLTEWLVNHILYMDKKIG